MRCCENQNTKNEKSKKSETSEKEKKHKKEKKHISLLPIEEHVKDNGSAKDVAGACYVIEYHWPERAA